MAFVTGQMFGWFTTDKEGNTRWRFDEAYVETGKGQGKSPWLASTALLVIGGFGRARAQAIITGPKEDQAMITMGDAAAMIRATIPGEDDGVSLESEGKFIVRGLGNNAHTVEHAASGGVFRTESGKSTQISGPRPDLVEVDEVHELSSTGLIDMHQAALAKNPRGGMLLCCSNTPAQSQGIGTFYSERAQRVASGRDTNENLLAFVARVDVRDRETVFDNEQVWPKPMPALGLTFPIENVRREVAKARTNPAEANRVKRLFFGIPTGGADTWLSDESFWERALAPVDEAALVNCPCWLSLDLSEMHDLTALTATWLLPEEGTTPERLVSKTWYWTVSANIEARAKKDQMPYDVWAAAGHLTALPGASINKEFVAVKVQQLCQEQNVQFLAFDVYKISQFIEASERIGFAVWRYLGEDKKPIGGAATRGLMLVGHGQGLRISFQGRELSMPVSCEALDERLRNGTLLIDNNPINTACSANAVPISDATGNWAFDKARSRGRIDGLITITMGVGAAAMKLPKPKRAGVILL
nr:terminase TerL endonuclease subunit [Polymorphobacter multimanifer]